jgi:transposase
MDLTDEQWDILEPLIPTPHRREDGRGQTLARSSRCPERHPVDIAHRSTLERPSRALPSLPETCHRRFQQWIEEGVLGSVLEALALDLKERGVINLSECYRDGTVSW